MGSLTTFGKEIENTFNIKTRTIPLASTLHALEATRKSMLGYSLDEIYRETLEVNNLYDNDILDYEPDEDEKKLAIITVCTTGEGGAKAIKGLLEANLTFDRKLIEIVPLNFIGKENIYERIEKLKRKYILICFVGPFQLDVNYPQFMLDDIVEGTCTKDIQKLIDLEKTYAKMEETLDGQLKNIDGKAVVNDIKKFNKTVVEALSINITTNNLIGVTLHIACMIDRIKEKESIEEFQGKEDYIKDNLKLFRIVKSAFASLNTKYCIIISDNEICYLMNFFNCGESDMSKLK
jgi:transcriptional regulatory protein LevR